MLTKKHFIVIAELIAESKFSEQRDFLDIEFANWLETLNPNFNRKVFLDHIWKHEEELQEEFDKERAC